MKHTYNLMPLCRALLATACLMAAVPAVGQDDDPCPGFRNPASFSHPNGNFFWSARVGERINNGPSTGYNIYSTCVASNCPDINGHNNIMSSQYNTGADGGITCCNHTGIWDAAQNHRFMVITSANAGYDSLSRGSGGGLQRIPEGYTSCLRLGDPRATEEGSYSGGPSWSSSDGNKSSEALFYTMHVTAQNALLFINYAVVARCFNHADNVAAEFLIRVVKKNTDGTWPNAPINDSLWFRVPAPPIPNNNIPPAPWEMGRPCGTNETDCYCSGSTCAYVYKPWAKVAISLNAFRGDDVRIEMYTSDCTPRWDPIYAYICGDYRAMILTSSGCPDPESNVVDTIQAPSGMLSYRWFVTTRGAVPDNMTMNNAYMDTIEFRQVYPPDGGTTTDSTYTPTLDDFILTEGPHAGDTVSKQTYRCVMTSALDPNKPFESRIYANISNRKPLVDCYYEPSCDTSIMFQNVSTVYAEEGQNDDSTHWVFYSDTLGMLPMDTVYGNLITQHFPQAGNYSVRLFVTTAGDPCTASKLFVFRAEGNPPASFALSKHDLCESDVLVMQAPAGMADTLTMKWYVDDSLYSEAPGEYHSTIPVGPHQISLVTTTGFGCSSTAIDSVTVYGQPYINLSSDVAAICLGDSVLLDAGGNISYTWNSAPYDPTLDNTQGQSSFMVSPTVTTTYYLLPSEDNPCSIEGAQVRIEVIPYPTPTIRSSSARVNIEDATLTLLDVSPYSASSHWAFSDGGTAEGARVTHSFTDLGNDSVGITLNSCNRLDCCDSTTIHLPVEVTTVWFPNTFTPEADNNNLFGVHSKLAFTAFDLYVYNRRGQLVYHSTDPAAQWNGVMDNGVEAPQGAYAWFCRYAYSPDAFYTAKGTVTLIR